MRAPVAKRAWEGYNSHIAVVGVGTLATAMVEKAAISRRGVMTGVVAFGSGAAVMGTSMLNGTAAMAGQSDRFAFEQLPIQTVGTVHVPNGYTRDVLVLG